MESRPPQLISEEFFSMYSLFYFYSHCLQVLYAARAVSLYYNKGFKMNVLVKLMLCWMISFSLIQFPMMKSAHAGMISTDHVVDTMMRSQDHQKVVEFMGRDEVKAEMVKLGVNPEEETVRLAGLSDAELHKMAGDIDKSTAGGDLGGVLVLILVIVLIIYLVKRI